MTTSHPVKTTVLVTFLLFLSLGLYSQTISLSFSFSADNNGQFVELISVKAINLTHGGETTITFPRDSIMTLDLIPGDTILYVGYTMGFPVGVQEGIRKDNSFSLFQNYPNPASDHSLVSIFVPEPGMVTLIVTDFQGRSLIHSDLQLDKGNHVFRISPPAGSLCFLTAQWKGISRSIKILHTGSPCGNGSRLDYLGTGTGASPLKATLQQSDLVEQESGILDTPYKDSTYNFQFAYNIPCPGTPTVLYLGQLYNTVQIFSQCWLKENLNVGTMLEICTDQTDNGYLEKYCYSDDEDSCSKYGGLYMWDEMMQYTNKQGAQGICPPGWHLPTHDEWNVLMGAADTQYGIGDPILDTLGISGFDAGTNLKSTYGWHPNSISQTGCCGTDYLGFTGLPGGFRDFYGCSNYGNVTRRGYWWTSTATSENFKRSNDLLYNYETVNRIIQPKRSGYSVRCIKNQD